MWEILRTYLASRIGAHSTTFSVKANMVPPRLFPNDPTLMNPDKTESR